MTASYDGAVAAIQQRMKDNLPSLVGFPPVSFQNDSPPQQPWPPSDATPFAFFEVLGTGSAPYAFGGGPGKTTYRYLGLIHVHIFVAINAGSAAAQTFARQAGEIFRNARFYNDEPPNFVWTISPQTDAGGPSDDFASYWRVTCTIPFEFYLQA